MSFKICIVGCGGITINQHGPSIKHYVEINHGVEFAGCCDIDEAKAKAFKEKFNVTNYYTDMDAMLDAIKPQAVCLTAPVALTDQLSRSIMSKGYPLILEKPPGLNREENIRMTECAKANNIPNLVAFNRRYMPLVTSTMEMIDSWGGPSCIMDIQYRMMRINRRDRDFSTTAIHGIDLVKHIAGAPYRYVNMKYNQLPQYGETVANFHLYGETENGIIAHLDFLPMSGSFTERLEINTHKGHISLYLPMGPMGHGPDQKGRLTHYSGNEVLVLNGEDVAGTDATYVLSGFYHENAIFFDHVRAGRKPAGDIASGLQSVEVADCVSKRLSEYRAQ